MNTLTEQQNRAKECKKKGRHILFVRRDIGTCRFQNTGKPYIIEQCISCKSEYVREL